MKNEDYICDNYGHECQQLKDALIPQAEPVCSVCKGTGQIVQEISEYRTPNVEPCPKCQSPDLVEQVAVWLALDEHGGTKETLYPHWIERAKIEAIELIALIRPEQAKQEGYDTGYKTACEHYSKKIKEARKQGRKDVVDAIGKRKMFLAHSEGCLAIEDSDICNFGWCNACWWQEKVKEWGLKEVGE